MYAPYLNNVHWGSERINILNILLSYSLTVATFIKNPMGYISRNILRIGYLEFRMEFPLVIR